MRRGRPAKFGATVAARGRPRHAGAGPLRETPAPRPGPARPRSPFCSHSQHSEDASGVLKWERRSLPLQSCAAESGAGSRDFARKKKQQTNQNKHVRCGDGGRAKALVPLGCGKAPGFSLGPCELVHLLFCAAASAAMSVVILHLDFGKTLGWIACTSPSPSRLLAERFGKEKREKERKKRVREEQKIRCVVVPGVL